MKVFNELMVLFGEPWTEQSFLARSEMTDQQKKYPYIDHLDDLTIAESMGPWQVTKSGNDFIWKISENPSINDRGAWEMSRSSISSNKTDKIRAILIGESAAGSFGYWDEFTIGKQLAIRLNGLHSDFEVIDLTCVNASMELCLNVMKQALTLDPDYFILYCGNNEGKSLIDNFDNGTLNAAIPTSLRWSFTTSKNLNTFGTEMVSALAIHCTNQLSRAKRISDHFEIPLLYILPESNSVDWVPQEKISANLPSDEILKEWSKNPNHPNSIGNSQLSVWECGKTLQASSPTKALDLYESARETGLGAFVNAIPQTVTTVANALRDYCNSENIDFIDMPALFRSADGQKLPDRHYFIDYCHLSSSGIQKLVMECAARISHHHGIDNSSTIPKSHVKISPQEEFLGAMVGAIHNYHYGQPAEIVAHWIHYALSTSWPHARDFLKLIQSFLLERVRETITLSKLESNQAFSELSDRYKLFFLKFAYHGRFDVSLVKILDSALEEPMLGSLLITRKDDILAFNGNMYSLFYMDCQKGIRPRLRGSNRTGWERPDLEFIIDNPWFEIDIPPTQFQYDTIEIILELEGVKHGTLSCELGHAFLGRLNLKNGRTHYRFSIEQHNFDTKNNLETLRFNISHINSITDKENAADRYHYLNRFGWYPSSGNIVGFRLCSTKNSETAKHENE
ncbi:hypothetical protein ABGV49_19525 [Chromobacterium vaccinii]|uniref:SGNH/GDSL hydrolase family protein n=1 Tax=Chromobacterium vaccinii TaxID=1108595 RepID=A0ABV0FK35_9NEIS